MTMVTYARLYGVITKIQPDGEFAVCEPIFVNHFEKREGKNRKRRFYRAIYDDLSSTMDIHGKIITSFEEVDMSEYGTPRFLPYCSKQVAYDKEYFVILPSYTNYTDSRFWNYNEFPIVTYFGSPSWLPKKLTVGIMFPNKYVAVTKNLTKDALLKCFR